MDVKLFLAPRSGPERTTSANTLIEFGGACRRALFKKPPCAPGGSKIVYASRDSQPRVLGSDDFRRVGD